MSCTGCAHKTTDTNNNRPKNTIVGQSEKKGTLRAPCRRAWIYVGGCEKETTVSVITYYIKGECSDIQDMEYTQLKTLGNLKAFKVGFKFEYLNKIWNENFWPEGLKIRKFNFKFFHTKADTSENRTNKV